MLASTTHSTAALALTTCSQREPTKHEPSAPCVPHWQAPIMMRTSFASTLAAPGPAMVRRRAHHGLAGNPVALAVIMYLALGLGSHADAASRKKKRDPTKVDTDQDGVPNM